MATTDEILAETIGAWVRFTADRITEESGAEGMAAESGWIDPMNMKEIFPNREDVGVYGFGTWGEAVEWIESVIGAVETTDGESYYGIDSQMDMITGDYWRYAAHISATSD